MCQPNHSSIGGAPIRSRSGGDLSRREQGTEQLPLRKLAPWHDANSKIGESTPWGKAHTHLQSMLSCTLCCPRWMHESQLHAAPPLHWLLQLAGSGAGQCQRLRASIGTSTITGARLGHLVIYFCCRGGLSMEMRQATAPWYLHRQRLSA
jgi:hypothetical protein